MGQGDQVRRHQATVTDRPLSGIPVGAAADQIASDAEEKLKSFTKSGGAETTESSFSPLRVRSLGPIASTLASTATGLSLNRKLSAGAAMRPFSIRKLPSRVS